MPRDPAYLLDILLYAKDAVEFTSGMDKAAFLADHKCQLAVIRCLEVIGEAAKRLSVEMQNAYPELPFSKMARMRDLLIHAYRRIDLDEVWDTVKNDLPDLVRVVEGIVPPDEQG